MNEQQVADLFSQQLDHLLQGQTPVLSPEASDLQALLDFGQQFSQITFQPSPAAQAAFQGQLASWFGPTPGGLGTVLGLSKTLLITLIGAVIMTGVGLTLLGVSLLDNSDRLPVPNSTILPAPQEAPILNTDTQDSSEPAVTEPEVPATPRPTQSSLGETIPAGGTSSLGDTLPPSSSMGDTMSLPTPTPTATAEDGIGSGEGVVPGDTGDAGDGGTSPGDDGTQVGDHDKGHGNDPDGIDEDNPGNSGDILSGGGNGQGQGDGLGGLGRGNDAGGGGGQGGGQGGGNNNGGGQGKGRNK